MPLMNYYRHLVIRLKNGNKTKTIKNLMTIFIIILIAREDTSVLRQFIVLILSGIMTFNKPLLFKTDIS